MNLQCRSEEEVSWSTLVKVWICSCSFSFSSFLQTRAVNISQTVRQIDLIPPPKVAALRGGSDEPTMQIRRGGLMVDAGQIFDLQLQL